MSSARFSKWAIRKKGTELYLPEIKHKRGYTDTQPVLNGGELGPRFLRSERAAINALGMYCKGVFVRRWEQSGSPDEGGGEEDYVDVEPNTQRDKSEFEIVEFEVREVVG